MSMQYWTKMVCSALQKFQANSNICQPKSEYALHKLSSQRGYNFMGFTSALLSRLLHPNSYPKQELSITLQLILTLIMKDNKYSDKCLQDTFQCRLLQALNFRRYYSVLACFPLFVSLINALCLLQSSTHFSGSTQKLPVMNWPQFHICCKIK